MNSLIEKYDIYEDEIILMIAKGNEEALELLFSLYETKMKFETNTFGNKFNLPTFDKDDLYQEIKITLHDAICKYDFRNGRFYTFWYIMMKRYIYAILKKESSPSLDSRRYVEYNEEVQYNGLTLNDYVKYDCEISIKNIDEKKSVVFSTCLKMWMSGYSYKEISDKLHISIASVNYHIRDALNSLRDILKD